MPSNFFNACSKYIVLLFVLIFTSVIIFYASADPASLTTKTYVYMFTLILPLFFSFIYIQNMTPMGGGVFTSLFFVATCVSIFFIAIIFYYFQYLSSQNLFIVSYAINIIVFIIVVIFLSILFNIFSNYLMLINGVPGIIIQFIFYIPCLFNDFVEFFKNQYNITSNTVFLLFILEILFLIVYFYAFHFINKIILTNGVLLLNNPVFLDTGKHHIAMENTLYFKDKKTPTNDYDDYRLKNYGLSMWIYVNSEIPSKSYTSSSSQSYTSSSNETTLFHFGHDDGTLHHVKPEITFDKFEQCFIFYFTTYTTATKDENSHKIYVKNQFNMNPKKPHLYIPTQKWNHFFFNYENNKADLYINGNLERTFIYNNNIPSYNSNDIVSIGDDGDSLNGGAICNVVFFKKNLSKKQIANMYNIAKVKNPPIS